MRSSKRTVVTLTLVSVLVAGLGRVGQAQERPAGADSKTGHLIWGAVGIPGVTLQGLPGAPVSDETGRYRAHVPPGWSGTVTPTKPGYQFDPPARLYGEVERDYLNEDYRPSILTYTISGQVGLAGVVMKGLPRNVVTDEEGKYKVTVEYGWAGIVTPTKEGYIFEPPRREYSRLTESCLNEDYTATVLTFTITGSVGLAGVTIQGLPGHPVSDENGIYSAQVEQGWSGKVRAVKLGYSFQPEARGYTNVKEDYREQDYAPKALTFTIAGNAGMAGVIMAGLPGEPITDRDGKYKATVEYGWTGIVTPAREGFEFEPRQREYSLVMASSLTEDYVARALTFRISGNATLPGVLLKGLPGEVVTDGEGNYSVEVPYGWKGKVTPMFGDPQVRFDPPSREYSKVTADLSGQDYRPAPPGAFPGAPPYGAVAPNIVVIPTRETDPKTFVELREDMQVMLQIVREKLSEPQMILGVLYDYGDFFGGRDRTAQAFYLQGYAVLFVVDVDFPLVASAPRAGGEQEPPPAVDPVWQRARERLYTPNRMRYGARGQASEVERMSFEQFQDEMIKTLKHAANIHAVEPNEWVILTLVGQSEGAAPGLPPGVGSYSTMGGGGWVGGSAYGGSGGSFGAGGFGGSSVGGSGGFYSDARGYSGGSVGRTPGRLPPGPAAPATVLTLQAKKADIDAFAKGTLDFEQFKQKVKIFTY